MAWHRCLDCKTEDPDNTRPVRNVATSPTLPPRCETHRRAFDKRQRKQARDRAVERTYDLTPEDNHALFLLQGGRCWLCRKATGATKSLAVDHDHATGEVRGRLCGPCNQFIGKLGDDPEAARRLVSYLTGDTPYRRLKAQQTLAEGFPDHTPVVHRIQELGGRGLLAFWTHNGEGQNASWVRTVDGAWTTSRE